MRFVCQHCGSKYTISDEKLRSKVLKIRCKKCDHVIEVRDEKASRPPSRGKLPPKAAPPVGRKSSLKKPLGEHSKASKSGPAAAFAKDEKDQLQWFVAINKKPMGPVSARKVHAYRTKKQITDSSLVWKEGMANWVPLRTVKDLVGLLATIDIEASAERQKRMSAPAAPRSRATPKDVSTAAGPATALSEKPALKKRKSDSTAPPKEAQEAPAPAETEQETIPVEPAKEDAAAKPSEPPAPTPGADESMGDLFAGFEDRVGSLHSLAPPRPANRNQNRVMMLASIGFFCVAVFTLGVAWFGGQETGEAKTVKTVERVIEKVVYRDRIVEKEVPPPIPQDEEKPTEPPAKRKKTSRSKSTKTSSDDQDAKTRALMERLGVAAPIGNAPIGGDRLSARQGRGESAGNGTLNANQVKNVVNNNKSRLKTCYERSLRIGEAPADRDLRVDFKLTIGSSGIVKSAVVGGEGARFPSLKQCVLQTVKKWVFPATAGDSPVEFPFLFTPK